MDTPKNHLSEIVLWSTHKICLTGTEAVFFRVSNALKKEGL